MRALYAMVVVFALTGCKSGEEASTPAQGGATPGSQAAGTSPSGAVSQSGGESGGIAPMTTAPIPNAPVSGSESLQGGGSAAGTIAKDRAKQAAGQASSSSLDQAGDGQ